MHSRALDIHELLRTRSLFLLGPRQTGKSTLLRMTFPSARFVDLLEADTFRQLSAYPESLRQSLTGQEPLLVIDEIQKLPSLLDEVQAIIDRNKRLRVVLTGSSARKLRRGGANLLAGRAWVTRLHPLVSSELPATSLLRRLSYGGLPSVFDSEHPVEDLRAYVGTYLQEEIRAEGLARSIEGFSRFLDTAGMCNGELLNYTKVGSDASIPPRTVRDHFQLLEDTLVAHLLPAFRNTKSRKPVATAKFYFFDVGIANVLLRRGPVEPRSEAFGRALEHLIFLELRAFLDYQRVDRPLTHWRTHAGQEVDFLVGDAVAIEVKGSGRISEQDLKGLRALSQEVKLRRRIVVCNERGARKADDGIEILPVAQFLDELWQGGITGRS
jgi:predicted AAA+ superfamily ATPase